MSIFWTNEIGTRVSVFSLYNFNFFHNEHHEIQTDKSRKSKPENFSDFNPGKFTGPRTKRDSQKPVPIVPELDPVFVSLK